MRAYEWSVRQAENQKAKRSLMMMNRPVFATFLLLLPSSSFSNWLKFIVACTMAILVSLVSPLRRAAAIPDGQPPIQPQTNRIKTATSLHEYLCFLLAKLSPKTRQEGEKCEKNTARTPRALGARSRLPTLVSPCRYGRGRLALARRFSPGTSPCRSRCPRTWTCPPVSLQWDDVGYV